MSSFKGSYIYAVDNKGRVNLPAKLRKCISPDANETFVLTPGLDQCLFVYPIDEWNKMEQIFRKLSPYNPEHRQFLRRALEYANESQLDNQARLTITPELRKYANILNEVRFIGTLDKIELWNPKVYEEYINSKSEPFENIAARVMG